MNNNRLEQNRTVAQLSKVLPVLLLPILLLVLLLCGLSQGAQAEPTRQTGGNLVLNPGFEEPSPACWENTGSNPPLWGYRWSPVPHEGDRSAEIWSNISNFTGYWRSCPFTVTIGSQYYFSGWIQAINLSRGAFLSLAFYSSTSPADLIGTFDSPKVIGSNDWITVASSTVAMNGAQYARIHCILTGTGTARFDDIFVSRIEPPTLVITKSSAQGSVRPGQSLVYTINYSNTGNITATQVIITETYDVNVDFDSAAPPPKPGDNRTWETGPLGPQTSGSIVVTVTVNSSLTDGLTLTNWVEMDCLETKSVTATTTTTVTSPPTQSVHLPLILKNFHAFCNGGFEIGDFTCWTQGGELARSVQSKIVYEGSYAALLGSPDYPCRNGVPVGEAWISQVFSVPPCSNPILSFRYRIFSNDLLVLNDIRWDSFDVYINDTLIRRDGNLEWDEAGCNREAWDSGWKNFSYSLSAYTGQNTQVSFHNVNRVDKYYNTWTYVDQVEITCRP